MKLRAGYLLGIGVLLCLQSTPSFSFQTSLDSTKNSTENGKYIMHRVEAGQTLYAVMRKYNTTLQALKQANPGMKDNLVVGQIVRVPLAKTPPKVATKPVEKPTKETTPASAEAKDNQKNEKIVVDLVSKNSGEPTEKIIIEGDKPVLKTPEPKVVEKTPEKVAEKIPEKAPEKVEPKPIATAKNGIHTVEGGQSLYGIAVKYGVLMADLRRWNGLTTDQLRAGQDLIVTDAAYQAFLRKNKIDSVRLSETAKKPPTDKLPPPPREDMTNANLPEPKVANTGKRILETGVAEVIDGNDSNNKYLALHRTAPIGSLIQVKNINNSASVWVKVIGKLPDISANNRIIIKLSARAQEKLSPGGRQFIAEISYLAQ